MEYDYNAVIKLLEVTEELLQNRIDSLRDIGDPEMEKERDRVIGIWHKIYELNHEIIQ